MIKNKYVIITPARNEEKYIEKTIQSMLTQTVKPERWVIVSDNSTDKTDEIVNKYAVDNDFIIFRRTADEPNRNFSSKVAAFNFGCESLAGIDYQFIGNLDADMSFEKDYYCKVLKKFEENPKLGIAGGIRMEAYGGEFYLSRSSRNSVAGAFQLFRRECFEKIRGYRPLEYGGIDAVAETMARMYGWQVESFEDIILYHHKPTGLANQSAFKARFRLGVQHYLIGYHPLFSILRFSTRITQKPMFISGFVSIFGFLWASLRRYERPVSGKFVKYLRSEQIARLKETFKKGKDPAKRRKKNADKFMEQL
jgi:glycosyltransferase involved in cell wall biosynthesis